MEESESSVFILQVLLQGLLQMVASLYWGNGSCQGDLSLQFFQVLWLVKSCIYLDKCASVYFWDPKW